MTKLEMGLLIYIVTFQLSVVYVGVVKGKAFEDERMQKPFLLFTITIMAVILAAPLFLGLALHEFFRSGVND